MMGRRDHSGAARGALAALLALLLPAGHARGEVVRIQVERREPFAGGQEFGRTGGYEILEGRLFFEADPAHPANARIADLALAPRLPGGHVEFWADFCLLIPADPSKGNRRLLYDVHNRGNKLALWTFNGGERTNKPATPAHAGNGFLFREGYSILWTGWSGDVLPDDTGRLLGGLPVAVQESGEPITGSNHVEITVDEKVSSRPFFWSPWGVSDAYPAASLDNRDALLTMRPHRGAPPVEIARDGWGFARAENGGIVPDPRSLHVREGFRPGWLYDLVYTARDPRVSGLGLAGVREAVSFFRHAASDREGAANPLAGFIDAAVIFGISQSGRLVHHFLYEGLNLDAAGRPVFEGAIIHVAGAGKGLFNSRFGMATAYGTARLGQLSPCDFFPFAPMPQTDPLTGETGDTLARTRGTPGHPKIFFVQTSTEYWSRAASLLHTDVAGTRDLELDPNVRIYHIAGTQHLGGEATERGVCRYPLNPVIHRGPVLRALLVAMNRWISAGEDPPPSLYPRIDDGTLVDLDGFQAKFPAIPGVATPPDFYRPLRLDSGSRWRSEGIADHVPPKTGPPFATLVPAVDEDGNEIAGIRLPAIAVPRGTCTGWNLRADSFGARGLLADLHGAYLAFPGTAAERRSTGDPRRSLEERYPTPEDYLGRVARTLLGLNRERYLLTEDVARMLEAADLADLP